MSESIVQVNPDGTGKQIRTELISGAHQQVVTLADSTGALLDTQLANLNLSLTALRDAITGIGGAAKTLADVVTAIQADQLVHATNLDVALSTRTKPADQQHTIVDSGVVSVTGTNDVSDRPARQAGIVTDDSTDNAQLRELRAIRTCLLLLLADHGITPHVASLLQEDVA